MILSNIYLYIYFILHINFFKSIVINLCQCDYIQLFNLLININRKIKYEVIIIINFCFFYKTKKF